MIEPEFAEGYVNFYRVGGHWQMCILPDPPTSNFSYFKIKVRVPDIFLRDMTEAMIESAAGTEQPKEKANEKV